MKQKLIDVFYLFLIILILIGAVALPLSVLGAAVYGICLAIESIGIYDVSRIALAVVLIIGFVMLFSGGKNSRRSSGSANCTGNYNCKCGGSGCDT